MDKSKEIRDWLLKINNQNDINLFVELNSIIANRFAAFNAIKGDLQYIRQSIVSLGKILEGRQEKHNNKKHFVIPDSDRVIEQSLWYAIIIIYGKCFSDASSGRKVKLESKECFKNEIELKSVHEKIINERNNFIAHGGSSSSDQTHVGIFYKITPSTEMYETIGYRRAVAFGPGLDELKRYLFLIEYLITVVDKKIKKIHEKLKNEVSEIPREDLLERIINENKKYFNK